MVITAVVSVYLYWIDNLIILIFEMRINLRASIIHRTKLELISRRGGEFESCQWWYRWKLRGVLRKFSSYGGGQTLSITGFDAVKRSHFCSRLRRSTKVPGSSAFHFVPLYRNFRVIPGTRGAGQMRSLCSCIAHFQGRASSTSSTGDENGISLPRDKRRRRGSDDDSPG